MKTMFRISTFILFSLVVISCNLPSLGNQPSVSPSDTPESVDAPDDSELPSEEPSDEPESSPEPSEEPTATLENTPGPAAGDILYQTEFDNMSGWQSAAWWQSNVHSLAGADFKTKIVSYVAEIRKGMYHFEVPKKYTNITSIYGQNLDSADVTVIADTIITIDRPWTIISVVCRFQENVGWYEFDIQSDGQWAIRKITYVDGTVYDTSNLVTGFSSAINKGYHGAENELKATCKADELIFIVNGVTLGSVKDASYTKGLIGVGAAATDQGNSLVDIDKLVVVVP